MKIIKNILLTTTILVSSLLNLYSATVYYSNPIDDSDTFCAVWTTKRVYSGELTGESDTNKKMYSPEKMYINTAILSKDGSISKLFSFPASLLITPEELEKNSLKSVFFIPRKSGAHYRKFITVEGEKLFVYEVGTETKTKDGKPALTMSVNFAKRRHIASKLDPSYKPWADENENIYYKAFDTKKLSSLYQWNSQTEKPEREKPLTVNVAPTLEGTVTEENNIVTLKLGENTFKITEPYQIIDPLDSNEGWLLNAYLGYGTEMMPFTKDDFKKFTETYDLELGKIIALNTLINANKKIVSEITDEQIETIKNDIQKMAKAFSAKKDQLREIKKLMREDGGITSILKKWLTNAEFNAILTAFDVDNALGGGVIKKFNHNGKTEIVDGKIVIPLGYYRDLKRKCRQGFAKNLWESYTKESEDTLKKALRDYSTRMSTKNLSATLNEFMQIKDQKDWAEWFDNNRSVKIELLFDYLATLDEDMLNKTLSELIKNQIKLRNLARIIAIYKSTDLYNGMKAEK